MTPEQIAYVARRRHQIRYWPWLALILVSLLAAGYGWLWHHAPLNLNPFLVLEQFHHKTVSDEEMIMLAARGSLALVTCGLFLLLIIFLLSVALLNERRLIRLLDQVTDCSAPSAPTGRDGAAGLEAGGAEDLLAPEGADPENAMPRPVQPQASLQPVPDSESPARPD